MQWKTVFPEFLRDETDVYSILAVIDGYVDGLSHLSWVEAALTPGDLGRITVVLHPKTRLDRLVAVDSFDADHRSVRRRGAPIRSGVAGGFPATDLRDEFEQYEAEPVEFDRSPYALVVGADARRACIQAIRADGTAETEWSCTWTGQGEPPPIGGTFRASLCYVGLDLEILDRQPAAPARAPRKRRDSAPPQARAGRRRADRALECAP
jgi:hypothetical protein